jgi:hypothetical protein
MAGDGGLGEAVEAAEQMLAEGAVPMPHRPLPRSWARSRRTPPPWRAGARAYRDGQLDQAEALLNNAPEDRKAPEIEAVRAQIALARQAANAGPLAELSAAVEADPATTRRASTMPRRCMRRDRSKRPSSSCWNCSGATASGTTCRQDAALHHLRRAEADGPDRAEGAPPLELDDICLSLCRLGRVS